MSVSAEIIEDSISPEGKRLQRLPSMLRTDDMIQVLNDLQINCLGGRE